MPNPLPIDVQGELLLAHQKGDVTLKAGKKKLVIDFSSIEAGRAMIEPWIERSGAAKKARGVDKAAVVQRIKDVLDELGLTVELRLEGDPLLRIGPAAKTSMTAKMFGLGPLELVAPAKLTAIAAQFR